MTKQEKYDLVKQTLEYMVEEGMVKKVKNGYRLKTKKELKEEMDQLLHASNI